MSVEILVPLDGSDTAEHALAPAVAAAKRANGTLHLCRVCPPADREVDGERMVTRAPSLRKHMRALTYLHAVRERLTATFQVRVAACVRSGPVAESILREARLVGAELIVLTTHGLREHGPSLIGSTADEVAHRADCPVLLLPRRRGPVDWSAGIYFRVLVPVEHMAGVTAAPADTPVVPRGKRVTCCLLPLDAPAGEGEDGHELGAEAHLAAGVDRVADLLAGLIAETGRRTLTLSAEQGSPTAAILSTAREYDADLIALGLPAKLDLDAVSLGDTAEELLLMASRPLLLQRRVARRPLTLPGIELPSPDDGAAAAAP